MNSARGSACNGAPVNPSPFPRGSIASQSVKRRNPWVKWQLDANVPVDATFFCKKASNERMLEVRPRHVNRQ